MSVLEAIKDFAGKEGGSIILITDGIESCGGDIRSIGAALKKSDIELNLNIIGFDIKEEIQIVFEKQLEKLEKILYCHPTYMRRSSPVTYMMPLPVKGYLLPTSLLKVPISVQVRILLGSIRWSYPNLAIIGYLHQ